MRQSADIVQAMNERMPDRRIAIARFINDERRTTSVAKPALVVSTRYPVLTVVAIACRNPRLLEDRFERQALLFQYSAQLLQCLDLNLAYSLASQADFLTHLFERRRLVAA